MDLSKVTFPTFVLEPRSMLERITDFMSHPDLIFGYVPPLPHLLTPNNLFTLFPCLHYLYVTFILFVNATTL